MNKRLYRSESDRVLGGVCAGLAQYLGVPALILRIFFILWLILGEFAFMVYVILWVVIPRQGDISSFRTEDLGVRLRQFINEVGDVFRQPDSRLVTFAGVSLIIWGVYNLLIRLGISLIPYEYSQYVWPVLLIIAGIFVLIKTLRKK